MQISGHSKESIFLKYINASEDKDSNADLFIKMWEVMNKEVEEKANEKSAKMDIV